MLPKKLFVVLAALVLLSGCAGRAGLGIGSEGGEPSATVPVFVATSRARTENPAQPFSTERALQLNFAKFDIGIPQRHVPGMVETTGGIADPARHFTARTFEDIAGRQQFIAQLDAALMRRPPDEREIFIFVHGYNNNFADSIFRNAQIVHDYDLKSVSLLYAWPSGGAVPLYVFDRDSALVARRGLAETIKIAAQTKATRIVIAGHSMGAYVVMEALRDLAISGQQRYLKRLGGVVLAAPDIDLDVFQSQVRDIGQIPLPFTILVSRRDRALVVSERIAGGHPRVGSGADIALLQAEDIAVLDVSDVSGGTHNVFASSETLMDLVSNNDLMRRILEDDATTDNNTVLASGSAVIEGTASLVVFLPSRLIGGVANVVAGR